MVKIPTPSGIPRLVLLDVDVMLTKSTTQTLQSILKSVSLAFGHLVTDRGLYFPGNTVSKLVKLILQANGITRHTCKNYRENVQRVYEILPQVTSDMILTGEYKPEPAPYAIEFIQELTQCTDIKLGLLTGNLESVSRIKLREAGFDLRNFELLNSDSSSTPPLLGVFGSDMAERKELIKIAIDKYSKLIKKPVTLQDVVVIGDTPRHIESAHDSGVTCVCVMTGRYDVIQLSKADFIIRDFQNSDACIKALIDPNLVY